MTFKIYNNKEWVCRMCAIFLDSKDLVDDGKCPNCESDESIFLNDLENDYE